MQSHVTSAGVCDTDALAADGQRVVIDGITLDAEGESEKLVDHDVTITVSEP